LYIIDIKTVKKHEIWKLDGLKLNNYNFVYPTLYET